MHIVRCSNIKKNFPLDQGFLKRRSGVVKALDGVTLQIEKGQVFGLVGESGCGKTTLGKILLGILKPDSGSVVVNAERRQAIFQDPFNSLDPKMNVFDIMAEGLAVRNTPRKVVLEEVMRALELVRLPKDALVKYPHQFSGGERQRIAIGRAILTRPDFIVCDEPVSSLDVTIQLEILRLLKDLQKRFLMTYLFISHDLKIVRFISDRIAVMKDGKIVEEGLPHDVYTRPSHPYTKLLLSSVLEVKLPPVSYGER